MPQHVFIQTDIPAAPALSNKVAATRDEGHSEAFASELNKYTQSAHKDTSKADKTVQAQQDNEAATIAKSEKGTVDDGNNLPPEHSASETENPDESVETATRSEQAEEQATAKNETTDALTKDHQPESAQLETVISHGLSSEKTLVGQDNTMQKAAKPALERKVVSSQPELLQKLAEKTTVINKTVVADAKQTPASAKQEVPVLPTNVDKRLSEELVTSKKGQPNLAAILDAKNKTDSKPASIRADILDALQRNSGDKDVVINLRNMMAAQMQEQSDKSDIAKALLTSERGTAETKATPSSITFPSLNSATPSTSVTTASAQGLSLPVQPNMQNPAWSQVMSSRVVWMAKEGVQQAQLKMAPANLGPVEVRLQLQNDQASVTFLAQHSATRDALEQAIPRLRESFAEAGIELGHTEVSEQQHQQEGDTEYADDSHIFAQASPTSDDIESEQEVEQPLGETTAGLSIYA